TTRLPPRCWRSATGPPAGRGRRSSSSPTPTESSPPRTPSGWQRTSRARSRPRSCPGRGTSSRRTRARRSPGGSRASSPERRCPTSVGHRRQEGRFAPLRRGAVDEQPKLLVAAVRELQRRTGLYDQDAAALELVPLRVVPLAHVDRERPVEDDEDLLLHRVDVAAADRAGRVAEEVGARPRHRLRQLGREGGGTLAARRPLE